jgi:hypothetical protein
MLNVFSPFEKTSNIARREKRVKAQPDRWFNNSVRVEVIKIDNRSRFGVERSTSGFA